MNLDSGSVTRVDLIRRSLLKDIYNPIKVRKSSDVRIILSSYERAGNLKVHKSKSYPEILSVVKLSKKTMPGVSKSEAKEAKRIVDARLSDAGFGGRILKRLFIHSKQSAKDSNKEQMLSAIKSLRIMGLELRNTR